MIGNDVVDLSDPETSRDACHPGFDRRVFKSEETRSLATDHSDLRMRWILWSAKEAAYKAARREAVAAFFSPARFVVDLDRALRGSVRYEDCRWSVRVEIHADCVHAVVSDDESFTGILSGTCRLAEVGFHDPSEGVRRFAISSIATQLGVATSDLRIAKADRIPQLFLAEATTPIAISLSHHGSYAGYACRDPRIERPRGISQRIETSGVASEPGLPSHVISNTNIACPPHVELGGLR